MTKKFISTGSPFEAAAGYSRAVVQGGWCFVSGTTGYDYTVMTMPTTIEAQTHNAMETIVKTLAEAGFSLNDVVKTLYVVADTASAERVLPIIGGYFKNIRPAATMIIANLIRPEMRIEIEVTAFKG